MVFTLISPSSQKLLRIINEFSRRYGLSAAACGYGSIVCGATGQPATSIALGTMAFCCTVSYTAAKPVRDKEFEKTKQAIQKNWETTKKNVGDAAVLVKDKTGEYTDKTKKYIVQCANNACKLVSKTKSSILPTRSNNRNYRRGQRRSGYRKMKRSSPGMRVRSGRPMAIDY